jgi:hypothetical protein
LLSSEEKDFYRYDLFAGLDRRLVYVDELALRIGLAGLAMVEKSFGDEQGGKGGVFF